MNDCYNANPISMRAALDHLASLAAAGRHVAVLGEMAELGPDAAAYHREAGAHARQLGVGPIVGVGELARDYAPDAWAPDAEAAVPLAEAMLQPGDAVLVKGSRSVGLELVTDELIGAAAARPSDEPSLAVLASDVASAAIDRGEILIAGMAAMLITIFLGPKFIEFLRAREFGQQIREEGPQEHHAKAGHADDGRADPVRRDRRPVPGALGRATPQSLAVFGVALGAAAARLRRRLHQGHQAPLARPVGALEAAGPDRPGGGALVGGDRPGRARPAAPGADLRRPDLHRPGALRARSSSW